MNVKNKIKMSVDIPKQLTIDLFRKVKNNII